MDNMNNEIYFTYGERLAALNKYLHYNIKSGEVDVYKEKQEVSDQPFLNEQLIFKNWYNQNFKSKNKLEIDDYKRIVTQIETYKLEPAYKSYLLSYYYSKLGEDEKSFVNAEAYISERPDYYHSYYNKYQIMRDKGNYMDAIVALEEMLQTSTINPYYEYLADIYMIEMYDKLLNQNRDQLYIDKINSLAHKVRLDLSQYFIDKETQKELEHIKSIEGKYKN